MTSFNNLNQEVAARIAGTNSDALNSIANVLVEEEVKRRTTAGVAAVKELRKMELEFRKLKPDSNVFDGEGKLVSEGFSQKTAEERKKLTEKIEKLSRAFDKAIEKGEYGDLFNLVEAK